jgi:hypothetical protein
MIKKLLTQAFQGQKPEITFFCSTDVGDIEGGKNGLTKYSKTSKKQKRVLR